MLLNAVLMMTQELEVNLEVHKAQLELRWLQRDVGTEVCSSACLTNLNHPDHQQ